MKSEGLIRVSATIFLTAGVARNILFRLFSIML